MSKSKLHIDSPVQKKKKVCVIPEREAGPMRDIYTHIFFFQREDHGGSYESTCMRFFLYCSCLRLHLSPLCSQLYVMQSALTKWDVSDFVFCPYVRSHFHINTMYRKLKSLKSFFGGLLSTKWIISVLLLLLRRTFNIVYWFHRIDTYVLLTKSIIFYHFPRYCYWQERTFVVTVKKVVTFGNFEVNPQVECALCHLKERALKSNIYIFFSMWIIILGLIHWIISRSACGLPWHTSNHWL